MDRIIKLFVKYRSFILFLALEMASLLLLFNRNAYQRNLATSSSNVVMASLFKFSGQVNEYISLRETNERLAQEIAELKGKLHSMAATDTTSYLHEDSLLSYRFIPGKVIKNTVASKENFFTVDKGRNDGIKPGMGVVSNDGAVGIIEVCSGPYCSAKSILHEKVFVSSLLKKSNQLCLAHWEFGSYTKAKLLHLGRHVNVQIGDTVTTSGGNSVFPPDIMVGTVSSVFKPDSEVFLEVEINLSVDFGKLKHVFVVENMHKGQLDSLEELTLRK